MTGLDLTGLLGPGLGLRLDLTGLLGLAGLDWTGLDCTDWNWIGTPYNKCCCWKIRFVSYGFTCVINYEMLLTRYK